MSVRALPGCGTSRDDLRAQCMLAFAVLLAMGIRLAVVLETSAMPTLRHPIGDAAGYLSWAARIADGDWVGDEPFYQAPLYPYVLGVIVWCFGESILAIRVAQAVWGGLGVWCLGYGTTCFFGYRTGVLAAFLLALYGPAVFFDGIIQKASLAGLLVCIVIAELGWLRGRASIGGAVLLGATLGWLILTRENAVVWIPLVACWVWLLPWVNESSRKEGPALLPLTSLGDVKGRRARFGRGFAHSRSQLVKSLPNTRETTKDDGRGWRRRWALVAAMVGGLALILLPVAVRNRAVGGNWSPTTYQSGSNFYIGNRVGADGRYQPLVRGHETPAFEGRDAALLAERHEGRELSPREVSRYWWGRAWREIAADPVRWAGLMGWKLLLVWNRYEVPDAESFYVYREFSWTLSILGSVFHFGVLCPLAAIGVVSTWRHWRGLWIWYALIVSMALSVVFFYVLARYRYPLVPLLIPFAAVGCLWMVRGATKGRRDEEIEPPRHEDTKMNRD